jgi:glycerol uptake facilitator-like aquaporin
MFERSPRLAQILRKSLAEFAGTALLVCVVVGSGIMGTNLSHDLGVALIVNALSTILALALLILVLGPISGAHLNPAVTFVQILRRGLPAGEAVAFVVAQITGAIVGAMLANLMFDLPLVQISTHERVSTGLLVGEVVATAGLIAVIGILSARNQERLIPVAVAAWIGSAYFFTSSTSFANPAVTIGRMFSDTFAGISPASVLPYIAAQLVGALIGMAVVRGAEDE